MRKHPVSAIVRLLPSFLWICACVFFLWKAAELLWGDAGGSESTWYATLFAFVLLALTAFGIRMAYKEYKDAQYALKADIPILTRLPKVRRKRDQPPTRYPLAEPLRVKASEMLDALLTTGVLQPGEVPLEALIDGLEREDEFQDLDIYDVARVLGGLAATRGQPFANLAFFTHHGEVFEADIVTMVREFARLSGQSERLGAIRVKGIDGGKILPAGGGEFPPANAVVEFELGTQRCVVPFVMYNKNIPGRLMQGLAKVFARADDPRRFVSAYYDGDFGVSYLSPEKTAAVNSALPLEPFELVDPP
jgi:hypothetical protein